MKPLVVYHGNCMDGFTGAWCFYRSDPTGFDFFPAVYGNQPPKAEARDLIFVDFCYPRDVMEHLSRKATHITVLDHHATAKKVLDSMDLRCPVDVDFDLNRSGAMIAWNWLYTTEPPFMIKYVQDRDLWQNKLPASESINAYIASRQYDFDTWTKLMLDTPLIDATYLGGVLVESKMKAICELYPSRRMGKIQGYTVPIINVPYTLGSDACDYILKQEPDLPFAAYYYDTKQYRKFGLRSPNGGVDVSEIAEAFGGGGHKHASGFCVKQQKIDLD